VRYSAAALLKPSCSRHIFEDVEKKSKIIWKVQMYYLLDEFINKPMLPPPFILINHAVQPLAQWESPVFEHLNQPGYSQFPKTHTSSHCSQCDL